MTDYIAELSELEKKATIGPWGTQVVNAEPHPMAVISLSDKIDHDTDNLVCVVEYEPSDAALISIMRNSLPLWLKLAEAAHNLECYTYGTLENKMAQGIVIDALRALRGK